jgi:hypothetical protein
MLIMYDGLATVSANFDLLAHAALMKSCEALESNKMMIGCPNSTKVHARWGPDLASLLNYR